MNRPRTWLYLAASWLVLTILAPPLTSAFLQDAPALTRGTQPGHPVVLTTTGNGLATWSGFYAHILPITIACTILAFIAATGILTIHRLGRWIAPLAYPAAMLWPASALMTIANPEPATWPSDYLTTPATTVLATCLLAFGCVHTILATRDPH